MKTLYVKYNRERITIFQTETRICKDDKGQKKVVKRALHDDAKKHIDSIYQNYLSLSKKYPNIKTAKCMLSEETVIIDYVEGETLEASLINALKNNDNGALYLLLEEYNRYLLSFIHSDEEELDIKTPVNVHLPFNDFNFKHKGLPCMANANIDINFDNIIIDKNNDFHLVDYEWVVNIKVPFIFIIYRAVNHFINKFQGYLVSINNEDIYQFFQIDESMQEEFQRIENNFQSYVIGNNPLRKYLKKRTKLDDVIIDLEQKDQQLKSMSGALEEKNRQLEKNEEKLVEQSKALEHITRDLKQKEENMSEQSRALERKDDELIVLTRELEQKNREIEGILNSKSWRITAPIREIAGWFK